MELCCWVRIVIFSVYSLGVVQKLRGQSFVLSFDHLPSTDPYVDISNSYVAGMS